MFKYMHALSRAALILALFAVTGLSTYAASLPPDIKDIVLPRSSTIANSNDWNIDLNTSGRFKATLLQNGVFYTVDVTTTSSLITALFEVWNYRLGSKFVWIYGGAPGDDPASGWTFVGSTPIYNNTGPLHDYCP